MSKIDELKQQLEKEQKERKSLKEDIEAINEKLKNVPGDKQLREDYKELKALYEEQEVKIKELEDRVKEEKKEHIRPTEHKKKEGKTFHDWLFGEKE